MSQRRPTKDERRDQARRERAALERRMASQRRTRTILIGTSVVAALEIVAWFVTRPAPPQTDLQALLASGPADAAAAGCSDVQNVGPYQPESADRTHIGDTFSVMPPLSTYPSIPPASGPHDPAPLRAGVYDSPPSLAQALHSLEHGGVIVWYRPGIDAAKIQALQDFYDGSTPGSRVIVAPYDYPAEGDQGQLPDGVEMALVAWWNVQTCASADVGAAFNFSSAYAFPAFDNVEWKGVAPEPGAQM